MPGKPRGSNVFQLRRKLKSVMSRKKQRRIKQNKPVTRPQQAAPPDAVEDDWSRSGAHNIAGVSFQVAVTAKLLLDGRAGELPLTRATPEGSEDIDIEFSDESCALAQVKERSPTTVFGRSDLVKALTRKSAAISKNARCRFVLATNATLGGGLSVTGWDQPLSQCLPGDEVDNLAALLGTSFDDPNDVLTRIHILRVEWSVVEESRRDFARILDIQPSVAALAYARLIEQITEIAVRQRHTTPETAEWIAPSNLNALVTRVLEAVDVESLDEAVRTGIIEPVDFSVRADLSATDFLGGVDVLPSHIASDLDLPRPTELDALTAALKERHSALLTGPSGAGKSALVWRTARELAGHVRPYRLLRLLPEDIPVLSRWIRLQEPSTNFPLLVCADNLGRPPTAGWATIAREFIDMPGVLLLGACREEDYHPELAVGRTTIVDPTLDRRLATSIAETLANRQVLTVLDVNEAFDASEGLLMEFLSMLLTGRRLQQVVEEQVAARMVEERATERDVLRYVATAHAAGVPLPVDVLGTLIPNQDLIPALFRLNREHILVSDDERRWKGLHELRSMIAKDFLHQFPPPTAAMTIRHLVEHLPARDASRIIESYALLDADLMPAAEAISDILKSRDVSADDATQLVSSLAMADAFCHARECLRVVEDLRPKGLDPETVLLVAYLQRFAGVRFDSLKDISPGFSNLTEIAAALPPRPQSLRDLSLRNLSSNTVREITTRGTTNQAIAWLESIEGSVAAQAVPTQELWTHFSGTRLEVDAPLSATLRALAYDDDATTTDKVFGDFDHRIRRLANDLPDCVEIDSQDDPDGKVVTLRLLVPDDGEALHDRSVRTCRLVFDLYPEADIAEVIVLTPDGDRHATGDFEPGYKRIPRANLLRPPETAPNASLFHAARLLLSSRYWTEPIRVLAECSKQLFELWDDSVSWLINPYYNEGRRRNAAALADTLIAHLAAGPREPVEKDATSECSSAREALSDALSVVRDIAISVSPDELEKRRLGARCRSAVDLIVTARQSNLPELSSVGDPLPDSLDEMLTLLADVLLASSEQQAFYLGGLRKDRSESWLEFARRFVNEAASNGYQAESEALKEALGTAAANCEIHRVRRVDLKSARFLTDWWVILVPAEGDNATMEDGDPVTIDIMDRLPAAMLKQLAFRTFIVFGAAGRLLPLQAVKLGGSQYWPADEGELSKIASGLGTEVMESTHLLIWDSFVTKLVDASRAATLFRLRQQAGLTVEEEVFNSRYESACRAAAECHPLLQTEAIRLLDRVVGEPHNRQRTLAGEVYCLLTHDEQSDSVQKIAALRIDALSLDL